MIGDKTRTVVIGVVTTVWAANFLAGIVIPGYEPSESINGIFMAVVGSLFALGAAKGGKPEEREIPPPPPPPKEDEQPKEGTAESAGP